MNFTVRQRQLISLMNGIILGAIAGSLVLLAAFDHNPQGEFLDLDTGDIVFSTTVPLFLIALIPITLITFFVEAMLRYFLRHKILESRESYLAPLFNALLLGTIAAAWKCYGVFDYYITYTHGEGSIPNILSLLQALISSFIYAALAVFLVEIIIYQAARHFMRR